MTNFSNVHKISISSLAANTYAFLGEFQTDKNRAKQLSFAGVFIAVALVFCPGFNFKFSVIFSRINRIFSGLAWLLMTFHGSNPIFISFFSVSLNVPLWRFYLLLCSTLSLITFSLLSILPESPKFLLSKSIFKL